MIYIFSVFHVFQRRVDTSVSFERDWTDYAKGFGDLDGIFWLGLDQLHYLTHKYITSLSVTFVARDGRSAYAYYDKFKIGNSSEKYRLCVSGYSGSAGDSLKYHNQRKFSTRDRDNDGRLLFNCARLWSGAWWYDACAKSNLNGIMFTSQKKGASWETFRGFEALRFIEMKLFFFDNN